MFFSPAQTGSVPLRPFVDDGNTRTHAVPPITLALVGAGGVKRTTVRIGAKATTLLVVDGISGRTLFVDRNGDGRAEAGEQVALGSRVVRGRDGQPIMAYSGAFSLPGNVRFGAQCFVSTTKDAGYAAVRDRLQLFPLSGYVGKATFGGKAYRIGIRGTDLQHGSLFIDRDGDTILGTVPAEMYALGKPFSLGGHTYRASSFQPTGRPSVSFATSATRVAEVPMPPDLRVGRVVPPVAGKTLAGKAVSFPKSFPGKLVLLDVWATWCGPCRGEIPFMKAAYAKYRAKGFEICSMSIDDPGMGPQVAAFTRSNGMGWTQVFQGQGWSSPVCQRYNIHGIPFMILVDGTTGRILAREDALRGPGVLEGTVAQALARR